MIVKRTMYNGWNDYPVYRVREYDDYCTVGQWMYQNECDAFLVSSGSNGYVFQVRKNHDWFVLKWV